LSSATFTQPPARDVAVVPEVAGEVHGSHAARADLAVDLIAPGEGGAGDGHWRAKTAYVSAARYYVVVRMGRDCPTSHIWPVFLGLKMTSLLFRGATSRLTISFATMWMAGCGDGVAPEPACRVLQEARTRIGENGGTVSLPGDAVVLTVPAGAVTAPCGIAVSIEPWTDLPSFVPWTEGARALFGTSYDVRAFDLSPEPGKVRLAVPATLTIRYDPASVPPGVSAAELVLAQETRVGCTPDLFGFGCSWDIASRSVPSSRVDTALRRLTGQLSCLGVCGGNPEGFGDGTGEFLVMHPDCHRNSSDPADPRWICYAP
jgi:hypothetical protein